MINPRISIGNFQRSRRRIATLNQKHFKIKACFHGELNREGNPLLIMFRRHSIDKVHKSMVSLAFISKHFQPQCPFSGWQLTSGFYRSSFDSIDRAYVSCNRQYICAKTSEKSHLRFTGKKDNRHDHLCCSVKSFYFL